MKYAYLVCVSADDGANMNKFYEMKENQDGSTFTAFWGRIEGGKQKRTYPMGKWDKKLWEKQRTRTDNSGNRYKYVDVTHLHVVKESVGAGLDISHDDSLVVEFFNHLMESSSQQIKQSYNISAVNVVTPAMIDGAQNLLGEMAQAHDAQAYVEFNKVLKNLFHVIPRKMKNVSDHLVSLNDLTSEKEAGMILESEQDLLNNLRGQVYISDVSDKEQTLFEALGLEVAGVSATDEFNIRREMGDIKADYAGAIKVDHKGASASYEKKLDDVGRGNEMLLWHGSRNENWISIFTDWLKIYPTGAKITGKMFGYGLYFAPKAKKSKGYTSVRGSYWAGGSSRYGYMCLSQVNMGHMWEIGRHRSEYTSLDYDKVKGKGFHSVYAKGGYDLINDEAIVYHPAQTRPRYLVRIT